MLNTLINIYNLGYGEGYERGLEIGKKRGNESNNKELEEELEFFKEKVRHLNHLNAVYKEQIIRKRSDNKL